ncbi:hypothetical protein NMG60_11037266 [Bertholletia excelsa]
MASIKSKERSLKGLYNVTLVNELKITPVLRGSFLIQGPVDETVCNIQTNMVLSQDEKGLASHSKSRKPSMRAESGTCNVCSAPCTSCLHNNRALMGSKTEECSDDNCQANESSQYSVNDTVTIKSSVCDSVQRAASETSNLLSVNSNHDSFSENAESKSSLRTCDASGTSEDNEMPINSSYDITGGSDQLPSKPQYNTELRPLSNRDGDQKDLEGHEVNISSTSLTGGSAAALEKVTSHLQAESETDKISTDRPAEAANSLDQIGETGKVKESCGLPDLLEALHSQTMEDSDGSDLVEQDVKVCDICGDAGREDLLAICNRCSDGAEHTYCMREMVDKVPEGDWLCEECKFDDENKSLKQDKSGAVDGNDKNQSSGLASTLSTDLFVKLDKKDSDFEGTKKSKDAMVTKASGKRPAENIEVASAVKRQALDPTLSSPKTSSPSRVAALSRDLSFRNLDKGKVKPAYQLSSGTSSSNNISETVSTPCPRPQTPRGALLKSNSFNYTTAKPKVKPVDEAVPHRKRLGREAASLDMKDGAARSIGKSMSFKSVNPSESKVKMLSPKFSHGQDLKGLKQAKDWNSLDRRNSFKSERSLLSSSTGNATVSTPKGEHKGASYGESPSLPSVSNSHEPKVVQTDNKLATLSKPSQIARRGSEMHGPIGGVKRQPCGTPAAGASSNNGASSSAEQKPDQTNLMESTNLVEKIRGNSSGRLRTSTTTGGKSAPCQKCKEIGHSADFCTVDNPRSLGGDMLATRNLRDETNNGNKLKAAIEAAMLKKPGICRKNKMSNQSEELPLSSTNITCETRPREQSPTSVNIRNVNPADEMPEAQVLPGELCKLATFNNAKQLSALPSEAANLKTGDVGPLDPSDGKLLTKDLGGHASAAISALLKISAIPEHEYIWQGGFEVHKSGERSELRDGIQAHLSTCASPKVLEMVNKFPSRIVLNEVARLSTWPVQFQKIGAKEDNIALYFFAKDLDSYEKSYKSLLDSMMRSDLALRGSFDGVELLIFPSTCLPEKSQRWNMLHFLWGVFRGKKLHCLQDVPDSSRKYNVPTALPSDILSLPESTCPLGTVNGDLPTCSKGSIVALKSECPDSTESPVLVNGDCHTEASYPNTKIESSGANAEGKKDCRFDATSLPRVQITGSPSSQETSSTNTPLEESINHDCEVRKENVNHESEGGKENVDHESKVDIEVQHLLRLQKPLLVPRKQTRCQYILMMPRKVNIFHLSMKYQAD